MKLAASNEPRWDQAQLTPSRAEAQGSAILAAVDSERRRIERDLHDGTQQQLIGAMMIIQQARTQLRADERHDAVPLLELAVDRLLDTAQELRRVTRSIYPVLLSHAGLVGALQALIDHSPLRIDFQAGTLPRLPEPVELAVYFVTTEALANILKHAGATHVVIRIGWCEDRLKLSISDDGLGTVDESRGTGVRGLRERVRATGGVLTVKSNPGYGTVITATFP